MKRLFTVLLIVLPLLVSSTSADAARKKKKRKKPVPAAVEKKDPDMKVKESDGAPAAAKGKKGKRVRVYDFGAIGIEGSMRTPALLYFLGRAREELDRASLERRSFMPELVRSVDEGSI